MGSGEGDGARTVVRLTQAQVIERIEAELRRCECGHGIPALVLLDLLDRDKEDDPAAEVDY